MRNLLLIARRECQALFGTPTAWALTALFQALGGFLFVYVVYSSRWADLSPFYIRLASLFLLVVPIFTMGRIAQERRQGTMELLLTSPVEAWELVGGKFLALVTFVGLLTVLSLQYPLLLSVWGKPDPGQWVPATLGLFLSGSLLAAVGLFASSLTASSVLAGVIAAAASLVLWWFHSLGSILGLEEYTFWEGISLVVRFADLNRGVLDTRDLFYFVAMTGFFLVLAARGVESDRW